LKIVLVTEAQDRLDAILDDAQREPVVILRHDQDVAVVLSIAAYERLRTSDIQAFLDLRKQVAEEAAAAGLTDDRLSALLPSAYLGRAPSQ
jgi:PHD/YefM family antitoxin component YafN of YafNO toxin-antitoxin module